MTNVMYQCGIACHMHVLFHTVLCQCPTLFRTNVLQSVRSELVDKEERDTTGLESLLEGDQESYFLSSAGDKNSGKPFLIMSVPLPEKKLD